MNKQCFEMAGVSYEQYVEWCNRMKLKKNKKDSLQRFFKEIRCDKIIKDFKNNKIIIKRK